MYATSQLTDELQIVLYIIKQYQNSSVTCGGSTTLPDTKYDHNDDDDQHQDSNRNSKYQLHQYTDICAT